MTRFVLVALLLAGCGPDDMVTPRFPGPVTQSKNLRINQQRMSSLNADAFSALGKLFPSSLWTLDPNQCDGSFALDYTTYWYVTKLKNLAVDSVISGYTAYVRDSGVSRTVSAVVSLWEITPVGDSAVRFTLAGPTQTIGPVATGGTSTFVELYGATEVSIPVSRTKAYAVGIAYTSSGAGVRALGFGGDYSTTRGFGGSFWVKRTLAPTDVEQPFEFEARNALHIGTEVVTYANTPVVVAETRSSNSLYDALY